MQQFSFAEVEAILARQFRIASRKRAAFRSRVKALQKYGVPKGQARGRGLPASFNVDQILQTALGLELTNAGLSPQIACKVVLRSWWANLPLVYEALNFLNGNEPEDEGLALGWCWRIFVENFDELMDPKLRDSWSQQYYWLTPMVGYDLWALNGVSGKNRSPSIERAVVINATAFFATFVWAIGLETTMALGEVLADYREAERSLPDIAAIVSRELAVEVEDAISGVGDGANQRAAAEKRREEASHFLSNERGEQDLWALQLALSDAAHEEMSWAITPSISRSGIPQTGEVLDRRREGQTELYERGLIEEPPIDAFAEPVLTKLGRIFVTKFSLEGDRYVDPEA